MLRIKIGRIMRGRKVRLWRSQGGIKSSFMCRNSGVFSTGAMGALAPAILGQSINVTAL